MSAKSLAIQRLPEWRFEGVEMSDLTIYPQNLAQMTVADLAALTPTQKHEVASNLKEAMVWLKQQQAKFSAALEQSYGAQGREALRDSGRDFGTAHLEDEAVHVKFTVGKKVVWDQKKLAQIAQRILDSGESLNGYMDVQYTISESMYQNWNIAKRSQFDEARTMTPETAKFELTLREDSK